MAKKIDLATAPTVDGTLYPPPFDEPCRERRRIKLGDAAGLTQFGVNLCTLPPGTWSSQRHWHTQEDELIYVVSGEVVLVTDAGEEILRAGDCAGLQGRRQGRPHFQNRSSAEDVVLMEIGTRIEGDTALLSRHRPASRRARPGATPIGTGRPTRKRPRGDLTPGRGPRPFALRRDGRPGADLSCRSTEPTRADVAIIGGGYTGLSAALHLAEAGIDVVARSKPNGVGWGASGRNGGQLHTGQRRDQDWLEEHLGLDDARTLWRLAEEAKALVKDLIARTDRLRLAAGPDRDGPQAAARRRRDRLCREAQAAATATRRSSGSTATTLADGDRHRRLFRRAARHGRRASRSAEIRARAGARSGEGGRAHLRGTRASTRASQARRQTGSTTPRERRGHAPTS